MKNGLNLPSYRLIAFLLLLPLLLSSCEQLGYIICPVIPYSEILIPQGPYDEEVGDCALVGKSEEIEIWLTELESIAESCHANRETNWADTLVVRDNLDSKIDMLNEVTRPKPADSEIDGNSHNAQPGCPFYDGSEPIDPSSNNNSPLTHYYTNQLMGIEANVENYCTMIDELVKPLWRACDMINFYQECQAPNPEQYHSFVELQMNAAQINYDYTDFFYTNTLQIYGWDAFMSNYNESFINCTPAQPLATNHTFSFSMNAFSSKLSAAKMKKALHPPEADERFSFVARARIELATS